MRTDTLFPCATVVRSSTRRCTLLGAAGTDCAQREAGRRENVLANFGSMKRLSFLAAINASGGLQRQVSAVALRNELRPANISPGIVLFMNDRDRKSTRPNSSH